MQYVLPDGSMLEVFYSNLQILLSLNKLSLSEAHKMAEDCYSVEGFLKQSCQ